MDRVTARTDKIVREYCRVSSHTPLSRSPLLLPDLTEGNAVYDLEPGHSAATPMVRRITRPDLLSAPFAELLQLPAIIEASKRDVDEGVPGYTSFVRTVQHAP